METFLSPFAGKSQPSLLHAVVCIVLLVAYSVSVTPLYSIIGRASIAVSIVPLLVAAFSFGRRGGLILGLLLIPINLVLFLRIDDHFLPPLFGSNFVAAHIVFLVTGIITGSLRDLRARLERELTERKQIEIERERSLELLRNAYGELEAIFENTLFGIALVRDLKILRANHRALEIMGYDATDISNLSCAAFFDNVQDLERFVDENRKHIHETGSFTSERQLLRKNGERIWLRLTSNPLDPNAPEEGGIWAFDDIEEHKQLEKRLRTSKQTAETAARSKAEFLAAMSHEIRTPLNATIGMTEMLSQSNLDQGQAECVSTLRDASRHLLDVVDDILDFSALEAGKTMISLAPFTFLPAIQLAMNPLRFEAQKKGLRFSIDLAPDLPNFIRTDPRRLRQILVNLVGNAIKYTDNGEVCLQITSETTTQNQATLRFDVIDTGIGINEEHIETIFNSFHRADASLNRRHGGTGLGLAISRKFANLLSGNITVSSISGQGSHFRFTLPIEILPQETPTVTASFPFSPQDQEDDALQNKTSLHILLVEDNPFNSKLAAMQLDRLGHTHKLTEDGNAALVALAQGNFDVVLMDIEMPGMDGLEATRCIRRGERGVRNAHIPIIAMTAHVIDDAESDCLDAGMNGYIVKPVFLVNLDSALRNYAPTALSTKDTPQVATSEMNLDRLQKLLMELGLTKEEFLPILHVAMTEMDRSVIELDRAEVQQNIVEIRRLAHTLKSTAAAIGAHALSSKAQTLHETVRRNPNNPRSQLLMQLQREVSVLHSRFDGLLFDEAEHVSANSGQG